MDNKPHRWKKGESGNPKGHKQTEASRQKLKEAATGRFGKINSHWQGGRYVERGYAYIKLTPEDFFYPMTKHDGYVFEHRLVVAKAIGRCLHAWEVVHHKHNKYPAGSDEDKQDNRYPENLQLVTDERHEQITILGNRVKFLESKIEEQGKLIKLLQWQVKENELANNHGIREERASLP